ncbi:MAG: response regulator [Candidatus Kapaibacterium sp.]
MHILLIEKDSISLAVTSHALRLNGYSCRQCDNSFEALRLFRQDKFDVVLIECDMPVLSGLELLELMKKQNPIPKIILLSSNRAADSESRARAGGASGFFYKPIEWNQLVGALDS